MGKELQEFALNELVRNLEPPETAVRVFKSKRRLLYDSICRTSTECIGNLEGENEGERWQNFKDDVPASPDCLWIDEANEIAYFLEIEDTHPLSEQRMNKYASAWWTLDMVYWQLILVVANRYGKNHHEVSPKHWSFHQMNRQREQSQN